MNLPRWEMVVMRVLRDAKLLTDEPDLCEERLASSVVP
jgi:hypothetical protein